MAALLQLDGVPPAVQQDLLLTALSVAGSGTAAPLSVGVLRLFERQLQAPNSSSQHAGAATAVSGGAAWRSHLLSRALLSNAATAGPLVLGVTRVLSHAAEAAPGPGQARGLEPALTALRPFLSFVLLDPQLRHQLPLLPLQLHSALARLACCTGSAATQHHLLALLVAHLPALRLGAFGSGSGGPGQQAAAEVAAAVGEVLDVVESCGEEPGAVRPVPCCRRAVAAATGAHEQPLLLISSRLLPYQPACLPCAHHLQARTHCLCLRATWSACATTPPRHRRRRCCSSYWRGWPTWPRTGHSCCFPTPQTWGCC